MGDLAWRQGTALGGGKACKVFNFIFGLLWFGTCTFQTYALKQVYMGK